MKLENLKFKKLHEKAKLPVRIHPGDAGLDLFAAEIEWDGVHNCLIINTGVAVEIPFGFVGYLMPRSSVFRTGLSLANSIGSVDHAFAGPLKAIFYPGDRPKKNYQIGDRVCQLVILPIELPEPIFVDEFESPDRGGGLGSTGL